jgi:hypothetical protein
MNISIDDMIKCIEREIGMRMRVYPRWVEQKKMTQEKALNEINTMQAVLEQLKKDKDNEQPRLSL